MIAALVTQAGRYALLALAVMGLALAALAGARRAGRQAERVDVLRRQIRGMEVRRDVDAEVQRGRDGAAARELRDRWARD